MKLSWLFGLLIIPSQLYFSQLSTYYFQPNFEYNLAETHYLENAYLGAAYDFNELYFFNKELTHKQKQLAELYKTNVGLLYGDFDAIQAFRHYEEKHPNDPINRQLYYGAGLYYMQKRKPQLALQYLSAADVSSFSPTQKNQYYFNLGYLYFENSEFNEAEKELLNVPNKDPYKNPRDYMLGHIAYVQNDNLKAIEYFEPLMDIKEYQAMITPYLVQIYFNQGNYAKCAQEGKRMIASGVYGSLENDLAKIVGESEFRLNHYANALPYLKQYVENAKTVTLPDLYQLGYVYYEQGYYKEAIELFNKITFQESPLAQNAFYQLGNSYLMDNQKKRALTAFKSASEMTYNSYIQQNALYNYALVSYDIGNPYEAASQAILEFIKKFPYSEQREEMEKLMISSFYLTKNYRGALASLASIANKNQKLYDTEQKLSLLYGIDLYNSDKKAESVLYFNQAINIKNGSDNLAKALYWKGSALYSLGNYQSALESFERADAQTVSFSEKQQIPYEMGYCYLKMNDFKRASQQFRRYLNNPKKDYQLDAQLRLADSYYGAEDVSLAINTYQDIENTSAISKDFATLQKAKLYGFQNNDAKEIEILENFDTQYPNSPYKDEANYELGMAYQREQEYNLSIKALDKVLRSGKNTELMANAMIAKGNDYIGLKKYQTALETFKKTANIFKNSDYAKQAVLASKPVFIEKDNISGYKKFAQENGLNIDDSETEELDFIQCQNLYNKKEYESAIPEMESFLQKYTNSTHALEIQYYLGNAYYILKSDDLAIQYLNPIAKSQNQFQEDALYNLGRIYVDTQQDENAMLVYEALYSISENDNFRSTAEVELMYLYDDSGNYAQAKKMAENVLTNPKLSQATLEQARVIMARSNLKSNVKEARKQFKELENAQNPSVKAEAYFYDAYFKNKEKKYNESNDVVFKLTSNISDEQYWGARALVIMAENYYYLKDDYQASYILDEVIRNYPFYPDIIIEAKKVQEKLKK